MCEAWREDAQLLAQLRGDPDWESALARSIGVAAVLVWPQTITLLKWCRFEWPGNGQGGVPESRIVQVLGEVFLAFAEPSAVPERVARNQIERLTTLWETAAEGFAVPPGTFGLPVIRSDSDPTLLALFITEAEKLIEDIGVLCAHIQRSNAHSDLFPKLRRQFHTLKGSGRLAGAMRLAEGAWQVERQLNRWLKNPSQPTDELVSLLQATPQGMQRLLATLKSRALPVVPGANVRVQTPLPLPSLPHATVASQGAPQSQAPCPPEAHIQGLLLTEASQSGRSLTQPPLSTSSDEEAQEEPIRAIFIQEAAAYLDTIDQQLRTESLDTGGGTVRSELVRAFHTLAGSARLAGFDGLGALARQLELLAETCLLRREPADAPTWQTLCAGSECLQRALSGDPSALSCLSEQADALAIPVKDGAVTDPGRQYAELAMDLVDELELSWEDETTPLAEAARLAHTRKLAERLSGGAAQVGWQGLSDLALALSEASICPFSTDQCVHQAMQIRALLPECLETFADMIIQERAGDPLPAPAALLASLNALASAKDAVAPAKLATGAKGALAVDTLAKGTPAAATTFPGDVPKRRTVAATPSFVLSVPAVPMNLPASKSPDSLTEGENELDVRAIFIEEAGDLLAQTGQAIQKWASQTSDSAVQNSDSTVLKELKRNLHTLKGSARMADCTSIATLAHLFESLLAAEKDVLPPAHAPAHTELMEELQMRLELMLIQLQHGEPLSTIEDLRQRIEGDVDRRGVNGDANRGDRDRDDERGETVGDDRDAVSGDRDAVSGDRDAVSGDRDAGLPSQTGATEMAPSADGETSTREPAAGDPKSPQTASFQEKVRIGAPQLDSMVNQAGEIGLYQIQAQQQINGLISHLLEMDDTIARLREQTRKLERETQNQIEQRFTSIRTVSTSPDEFDPLEMERFSVLEQQLKALAESITDITNINRVLHQMSRETKALMARQSNINTALQEGLMSARLVPFISIVPRLRRIVRQSSQELHKKAQLQVLNDQGELDRSVIEKILPPLEHMLRNSIVHGIESPQQRIQAGKSEMGQVTIELAREGPEIIIRLQDDGAGIDLDAIRRKAERYGWLQADNDISSQELTQFIFAPGFSTADHISSIAGRGVGMDVVHKAVGELGGSIAVTSQAGKGTQFTIRIPFTLAIHQVLMVAVEDEVYGLPLSSIQRVVRLPASAWNLSRESPTGVEIDFETQSFFGIELRELIQSGRTERALTPESFFVILLQVGENAFALRVDGLIGKREIMVKTLGSQISAIPGVLGATLLDSGRAALILDVASLIQYRRTRPTPLVDKSRRHHRQATVRQFEVMVVDDSITVRQVTQRLFQRHGFVTHVAKDGVEAMNQLQDILPDLIILDVEMPRMDGFELASYIRSNPRLAAIPMIMLTSRVGAKHQLRAEKVGVNVYMGKPYHESELLENARTLLGVEGV